MEKIVETVNIFDFDGTVFRSPVPSPALWDGKLYAKIKDTPARGYGWFQDTLTLSEPAVPDKPGIEWWNEIVLADVHRSMEDKSARTFLLTGRTEAYKDRIVSFSKQCGIVFDEFGLKPIETSLSTMAFKQAFITNIILLHNPKSLHLYEDRPKHAAQFTSFFSLKFPNIKAHVHLVDAVETILHPDIEIALVNKLREKYHPEIAFEKSKCAYTGVKLLPESIVKLKTHFPPIEYWRPYYEHMTICLGHISKSNLGLEKTLIGTEVELRVTHIGKSNKCYAARVTGFQSINRYPHITLCVAEGAKPVQSNNIEDWAEVAEEIVIRGVVQEFGVYFIESGHFTSSPSRSGGKRGKKDHFPNRSNNNSPAKTPEKMPPKGADIKMAIESLDEWLVREKIEYSIENYQKIRTYVADNWKS